MTMHLPPYLHITFRPFRSLVDFVVPISQQHLSSLHVHQYVPSYHGFLSVYNWWRLAAGKLKLFLLDFTAPRALCHYNGKLYYWSDSRTYYCEKFENELAISTTCLIQWMLSVELQYMISIFKEVFSKSYSMLYKQQTKCFVSLILIKQ